MLNTHKGAINLLRNRSIDDLQDEDASTIKDIFYDFETLLGPVGAAKCLHLLAPKFFPLWDRKIAKDGYGIYVRKMGQNKEIYYAFMQRQKEQCDHFGGEKSLEG